MLHNKKRVFWICLIAIVIMAVVGISLLGKSEDAATSVYKQVNISDESENKGFKSRNGFEESNPQVVDYIDETIRASLPSKQEEDLKNNHTNQYTIKLSNETGGYSCALYYDTLYDKAYLVRDGGFFDIETDFARYIDSFFENTSITFNMDKEDVAIFEKYGWTLDYQINEIKDKINNINNLSDFNPNAYYFAYNNELSKDIQLDMSQYANRSDLDVKIYRIHEAMPKEFYPIQDCRGIVVKSGHKIIAAYISAGRHSTFNACSLNGKNFESVTGETLDEWLSDKIKADVLEKGLAELEPKHVIAEYFAALNNKDMDRAKHCISKMTLLENLTTNMPNEELFNEAIGLPLTDTQTNSKSNFDNLKSAKLSKIELLESDEKIRIFRVYVNLQCNKESTISNGEQFWDCYMIYESPQTGWKIEGFGHG